MILQNDGDDAVPWYQGIEFFLALRRLGKEVYMFNYNGQPHGLRNRADQKDYTIRLQQYFDHYPEGRAGAGLDGEGRAVSAEGKDCAFGVRRQSVRGKVACERRRRQRPPALPGLRE